MERGEGGRVVGGEGPDLEENEGGELKSRFRGERGNLRSRFLRNLPRWSRVAGTMGVRGGHGGAREGGGMTGGAGVRARGRVATMPLSLSDDATNEQEGDIEKKASATRDASRAIEGSARRME